MSNALDQDSINNLKASLRGSLIEPGAADYDAARKVYNAMIDKKPRLIARCVDVADVIASVNFARENKLLLAIRGGVLSGRTASAEEIETLATLPPLEVLRGQVLGAIIAPLSSLIGLVNAPLQNLYGLIDARIEQLGGAEETPAEPATPEAPAEEAPEPAAETEETTTEDEEKETE